MIDANSPTWAAVREIAEGQIRQSTDLALSQGLDHGLTEFERGQVAAMKKILKAAETPPQFAPTRDPLDY